MNTNNEGKSGFLAGLFGLGGLLATKAGVVGLVLGAATLGVGGVAVYNAVSVPKVNAPQAFDQVVEKAVLEKATADAQTVVAAAPKDGHTSASLNYFKEGAQKDKVTLPGMSNESASAPQSATETAGAGNSIVDKAAAPQETVGTVVNTPDATSRPKMASMPQFGQKMSSGLSGSSRGSTSQAFGSAAASAAGAAALRNTASANAGTLTAMNNSRAAAVSAGAYRGGRNLSASAYGQAKAIHGMMNSARGYTLTGGKATMVNAYEGGVGSGSGDVASAPSVDGNGSVGLSDGASYTPETSSTKITPPTATGSDVTEWKPIAKLAKTILIAAGIAFLAAVATMFYYATRGISKMLFTGVEYAGYGLIAMGLVLGLKGQTGLALLYASLGGLLVMLGKMGKNIAESLKSLGKKDYNFSNVWKQITGYNKSAAASLAAKSDVGTRGVGTAAARGGGSTLGKIAGQTAGSTAKSAVGNLLSSGSSSAGTTTTPGTTTTTTSGGGASSGGSSSGASSSGTTSTGGSTAPSTTIGVQGTGNGGGNFDPFSDLNGHIK